MDLSVPGSPGSGRRPRLRRRLIGPILLAAATVIFLVVDGRLPLATDRPDLPLLEAVAAGFLTLAAMLAVGVGASERRRGSGIVPWLLIALFFAFMALNIATELDHVIRATGIRWQEAYAPMVIIGAAAFVVGVQRMLGRYRSAAAVLAGGALIWVAAVGVWSLGWPRIDGPLSFSAVRAPERALEAIGSMLLAAGLAWLLRSAARDRWQEEIAVAPRSSGGGTNVR